MEPIPKAEFSIVTRASSSAWIPELIASAGPEVTLAAGWPYRAELRHRNPNYGKARRS